MRELSVQAGNSTLNASDRATIQAEIDALAQEIDAISTKTNFNQVNLLDGTRGSVSMQIGIDKGDELSIALQKTDVSSLGIGSSATKRVLTSERVSALPTSGDGNDLLSGDIKINGQDAFSSNLTTSSVTGLSFAATNLEAALAANTRHAGAMAAAINTNSAVHGATASAFNTVRGASSAYTAGGTITVNGETIANNSKQGFVDEVNNSAAGVQASIDDAGRIVFSNDDGDTVVLAGAQIANVGHVAATYAGFIQIENADGSDVTIEAGNTANGYGSSAAGTVGDLNAFGFNQNFGTTVRGNATTSTAPTSAMNVKINGVAIGASTDGSALSKAAAINAANAGGLRQPKPLQNSPLILLV